MFEISVREVSRRARRIWLRLRTRFNYANLGNVEINEMSRATKLFWLQYTNNYLRGQPLNFVAMQGTILLATGAKFSLVMSQSIRNIDEYIQITFDYLDLMLQGIDIYSNGLYIKISGDDLVDPQDITTGRIDFRIALDMLYPTRNILPSETLEQNFNAEDQQPESATQSDNPQTDDDFNESESIDQSRFNDYNIETQINRYEELYRRISLLENELENINYTINQNEDLLNSLRIARNRWSAHVQQLRREVEIQMVELRRNRDRISRQLRGLRRLFFTSEHLTSDYEPDTEDYSSSDYSNLQSSPFRVPDDYLDSGSPTSSQLDLYRFFDGSSLSSPASTRTSLYNSEELEELDRLQRRDELNNEIEKAEYQINQLDDLIRDLRNRKINRKHRDYIDLNRSFESQKSELKRLIQQWKRELRSLRRNID